MDHRQFGRSGLLAVKLTEEELKGLEEASRPAWGYPYSFIGGREPW